MSKAVANQNGRYTLSIHGNCLVNGSKHDRPYNSSPQENLEPSTVRGARRKVVGKKKGKK